MVIGDICVNHGGMHPRPPKKKFTAGDGYITITIPQYG